VPKFGPKNHIFASSSANSGRIETCRVPLESPCDGAHCIWPSFFRQMSRSNFPRASILGIFWVLGCIFQGQDGIGWGWSWYQNVALGEFYLPVKYERCAIKTVDLRAERVHLKKIFFLRFFIYICFTFLRAGKRGDRVGSWILDISDSIVYAIAQNWNFENR